MEEFLVHLLVTAALLAVVAWLIPGVEIKGPGSAILGALVLGLANALVRPILVILTLPLTILTLGLFLLVINALMLMLAAAVVPGLRVEGCGSALLGSLVLSLLNLLVSLAFGIG
jgi:putative membrane protein